MDAVKIFLSHTSQYIELARSLKNSLHALETKPSTQLDVKISEDMEGATGWREWIEDNVRGADIFLLLYPQANIDMSWCNYELGRFYDGKRKIVCIKNTDIPNAPAPFQAYQSYDGDEPGILKFIDELFVKGTFTDNRPLNPKIGLLADEIHWVAQSVARQLAQKFAAARLQQQFYERRVVFSVRYDAANQFDPKASTVYGNAEGMKLLGFGEAKSVPWSAVRSSMGDPEDWPSVLEKAIPSITGGALPPTLPPFLASGTVYIPGVAGALGSDDGLKEVVLTFAAVDAARLRPLVLRSGTSGTTTIRRGYAFVAMAMSPNDPTLADVLDAIKEGANSCGIKAERIDEAISNEPITQRMLVSIQAAEYVIADITNPSTNVSYEAGYAYGLGKTPIYVARVGATIPFDIKDYPVIYYSNMRELKTSLAKRLRAIKLGSK
jgi:hypothetical protein